MPRAFRVGSVHFVIAVWISISGFGPSMVHADEASSLIESTGRPTVEFAACDWDNGIVPNGFNGRALSPPNFPDIRVADDFEVLGAGCLLVRVGANVIEDAGWTHDGLIEVAVYADTGEGPGPIVESVTTGFTRTDTGNEYFGRQDYEYSVEGLGIELEPGTYWIGLRNPGGGGSGTNYWLTSDGDPDGPGSDTGWFSLDAGGSWSPEGNGWHHAFILNEAEVFGACCEADTTCRNDVPRSECDARFVPGRTCEDLDPPCVNGACCQRSGGCADDVPAHLCGVRFEPNTRCEDIDPPCGPIGACCADDGACTDHVREEECSGRFEPEELCENLDPPCVPHGACCVRDGTCTDDVREDECSDRFAVGALCEDLDPPCGPIGACCARDGTCTDDVPEEECSDRFEPEAFCEDLDPPCEAFGACCIDRACVGTMRQNECQQLGGRWFIGEDCDAGYECPDILPCGWDNGVIPDGFSGRALSPPGFPNIRVADDFGAFGPGCLLVRVGANVIEDDGWTHDGLIEVAVYGDTGNGPGPIVESVTTGFTRIDTGDVYFGRRAYEYWVDGLGIELEPGTYWLGLRNPGGGGAGTNYWLTSDGGLDGPGSDTGWFSLDAGNTWSPEGNTWHHAFILNAGESVGACCEADTTCRNDVPRLECDGRFVRGMTCEDLDPPCVNGSCCQRAGDCIDDVPAHLCELRFEPNTRCEDLDPPCALVGACCADDGTCTDDVPEEKCSQRFEPETFCENLDPPCVPHGACCGRDGACTDDVREDECSDRFAVGALCEEFDPPCGPIGACCARDGTCTDDVPEEECSDRFELAAFCDDLDPPCAPFGACCVDRECVGTMQRAECRQVGGRWFIGEDCDAGFECPDILSCGWDNGVIPDGFSGRALSPPNFPDIRVADDFEASGTGCRLASLRANVIEDNGWTYDGRIEVTVYEDTGNGPGPIVESVATEFTRTATGDEYFGRQDYEYWVDGLGIELEPGRHWIGLRNPGGGGAGTNYWLTSDGGLDGPGSDTGWFSLDAGATWSPEGAGWHHAFILDASESVGACCEADATCRNDVLRSECDGRFVPNQLCEELDPPCVNGACCQRSGDCADDVPAHLCELRFEPNTRCEDLDPPCSRIGACCANDGACTDDVPEEECSERFEFEAFCDDLDPPCVPHGACCGLDGSCADDVREDECGDRFEPQTLCEDLDPVCEPIGGCCLPERACPDREWVCDGDVDGDGQVNPTDSGLVQAAFDSRDERDLCQYDIDCDEQINPFDLGLVQSLFGTCEAPRPPCIVAEHCEVIPESECQAREGVFLGGRTDCEDDPCGD